MNFSLEEFRVITFAIFFLYIFFETKVYLSLWAALYHGLNVILKLFDFNMAIYKIVISVYVILVLAGYLYKFRHILFGKEKISKENIFEKLSKDPKDKARRIRIGIAIFLLIIINIATVFIIIRRG